MIITALHDIVYLHSEHVNLKMGRPAFKLHTALGATLTFPALVVMLSSEI